MIEPVEVVVVLNTSQADAFDAFVANINDWWPVANFSVAQGTVAMDRKLGGKITETAADGTTHIWGHITAWDPGHAIDIAWYVGGPAKLATDIAVRFAPTDDGRTGVTLVHSGWDVLKDAATKQRENYQMGWDHILGDAFASFAATHCPQLAQARNTP